jgi:hypothetical protein
MISVPSTTMTFPDLTVSRLSIRSCLARRQKNVLD